MFPTFDFDTAAHKLIENDTSDITISLGRVMLMDFKNGKLKTRLENGKPVEATTIAEKVQTYIKVLLRTQFEKYKVYANTGFGVTYFNYLGQRNVDMDFIKAELKREVIEKIEALDVVDNLTNFSFTLNNTTLTVTFTINLVGTSSVKIEESVGI